MTAQYEGMRAAQETYLSVRNTLGTARDATIAIQSEYQNRVLGLRDQVIARLGADSDEVAPLGLKKKSERKASARVGKPAA